MCVGALPNNAVQDFQSKKGGGGGSELLYNLITKMPRAIVTE